MTGQLLQTSLEYHQLEVGSFIPIFQLLFEDRIQLTSPTCMKALWEFFSEHHIDLSRYSSRRIVPLRVNDKSLIEVFTKDNDITTAVRMSNNKVWGYHEVFTLADVATSDGTKIRPCLSVRLKSDTKSNWDWQEERPSALDRPRWKEPMLLFF